ncbi:MAG: S8 family serine peptidase [Pyrinomonadaceae bacterium]
MRAFIHRRYILFILVAVFAAASAYLFSDTKKQSAQAAPEKPQRGSRFEKFRNADAVTAELKKRSNELIRVEINSLEDRRKAERAGTIVEDFASFVTLSKSKTADIRSSGLRFRKIDTSIDLPGAKFDPISETRPETVAPNSNDLPAGGDYYIVQFGGTANGEWIESLKDAGVEVLQYVPNDSFLVYGDGAAVAKVAGHSRVRWTGRYTASHKIPDQLKDQIAAAKSGSAAGSGGSRIETTSAGSSIFDVAVFARADADRVAAEIANTAGGRVVQVSRLPHNFFNIIRVEMPADRVEAVADLKDIVRIDASSKPVAEDERAADIVAGNYSNTTTIIGPGYAPLSQFGVAGQGVTVSMVDDGVSIPVNGGLYITSANTINGPLRGAAAGATGGHGHLNASIVAGSTPFGPLDPLGYNYGVGVAPAANIINIPLLVSGYSGSDSDPYNDTVTTAGPNGVNGFISNNSWGAGTNGNAYDSFAALFDGIVRDASYGPTIDPLLLVFSAGNSGPGALSLTRPKAAKNIISVGNSENLRMEFGSTNANNIDDLRSSSSRGPTADGRIKPDITAPGSYITGSRAGDCSSVTNCFDANHVYSIGTSHSAPQVAGAAALFTEFWKNGHAGQNPSPALIKAAILDTGQEMNGLNTTASIPNGAEGWGRINMKYMLNTGVPMKYVNETAELVNVGENYTFGGVVGDASKPLRISLVWTDPPAAADPALVNNLDLSVTVGGSTYRGNVFSGGLSTTGGTADTVNNVENVWLPAGIPAGTAITIQITAAALNGDGILGNSDTTDQNFGLVGYNFADSAASVSDVPSDFDGDGKSDIAVWRPSNGGWYVIRSSDNTVTGTSLGVAGDVIVPGDYDGDGKTDVAVWRPSDGVWYINRSTAGPSYITFGQSGDIPVAGDYDGDDKYDVAVWRPSTGVWYILQSTAGFEAASFGSTGDKPVPGNYDGDNRTDIGIFRPSDGNWYLLQSIAGVSITHFGIAEDRPVQADYDGDGKTDIAIWRPSSGAWYLLKSTAGFAGTTFGVAGDIPAPGDYDGDGKDDIGLFRGSEGNWYQVRSQLGFGGARFGAAGDIPVETGYIPQ